MTKWKVQIAGNGAPWITTTQGNHSFVYYPVDEALCSELEELLNRGQASHEEDLRRADSQGPKTCTMTRIHDEILIECVEMGADGVPCDLCRGRYDGVLEMLRIGVDPQSAAYFCRIQTSTDCGCSVGSNNCGC